MKHQPLPQATLDAMDRWGVTQQDWDASLLPAERHPAAKCPGCGHPASFHGFGTRECGAFGCDCPRWAEQIPAVGA